METWDDYECDGQMELDLGDDENILLRSEIFNELAKIKWESTADQAAVYTLLQGMKGRRTCSDG